MKRISTLSMALFLALCGTGSAADIVAAPDRAAAVKPTNDNLLISSSATKPRRQITVPRESFEESFSRRMARNGWALHDRSNDNWENFRKIVSREEFQGVQEEINAKFFESRRSQRSVEASA